MQETDGKVDLPISHLLKLQLTCLLADPEEVQNEHAFKSIQRLNIRTFSSLLQSLGSEYRNRAQEGSKMDAVTSTVRRLLPSLRYYSAWLISRAALLSVHLGDSTIDRVVKDFWAIYAETTSLLLSATEINNLPRLEYLLEEDAEIIGFRPLQEVQLQRKPSVSEAFMRRIKYSDVGLTRVSSDVEMRCRIRDFLEDCLELAENDVRSTYPTGPNQLANEYTGGSSEIR